MHALCALQVADEIANKMRDESARQQVVHVQRDIFGGTIDLVAPHRLCHKNGEVRIKSKGEMFMKKGFQVELSLQLVSEIMRSVLCILFHLGF